MSLYGLPFDGIKGIRAEIVRVQGEVDSWRGEADALKKTFADAFGRFGLPIGLVWIFTNSYMPLIWRDHTKESSARVHLKGGLFGEIGQQIMAGMPEDKRRVILDIEYRRMHLNHVIGMLMYEMSRLRRLERDFEGWRNQMRLESRD